jgi:hypothetical protein
MSQQRVGGSSGGPRASCSHHRHVRTGSVSARRAQGARDVAGPRVLAIASECSSASRRSAWLRPRTAGLPVLTPIPRSPSGRLSATGRVFDADPSGQTSGAARGCSQVPEDAALRLGLSTILDEARSAHQAGFCVLPAASDGSRCAHVEPYQRERPTFAQMANVPVRRAPRLWEDRGPRQRPALRLGLRLSPHLSRLGRRLRLGLGRTRRGRATDRGRLLPRDPGQRPTLDRAVPGVRGLALSQVAADLLTSPGRGPNEAEALMEWMRNNEDSWRARFALRWPPPSCSTR